MNHSERLEFLQNFVHLGIPAEDLIAGFDSSVNGDFENSLCLAPGLVPDFYPECELDETRVVALREKHDTGWHLKNMFSKGVFEKYKDKEKELWALISITCMIVKNYDHVRNILKGQFSKSVDIELVVEMVREYTAILRSGDRAELYEKIYEEM